MQQLTTLFDSVAALVRDGVILADAAGHVLYHNIAAASLLSMKHIHDLQDVQRDVGVDLPRLISDKPDRAETKNLPAATGDVIHIEHWVNKTRAERLLEFNVTRVDVPDMPQPLQLVVVSDNTSARRLDTLIERSASTRLVTQNDQMRDIVSTLEQVAPTKAPVLLQGESGTGKSMFAKIIHNNSERAGQPFVKVNCAAIPETLLESELFGHVKGAFTGAHNSRPGRFQAANGGTLFLDEISEIPLHLQPKLLTALEEQRFQMVGSDETVEVDIRVIAASNQNLADMVEEGTFRADLYYRLGVFNIEVPPLRDRPEDIPLLIKHLCDTLVARGYRKDLQCTEEAMGKMLDYPWPGNIRELANAVEHAMILAKGETVTSDCLPKQIRDYVTRNGAMNEEQLLAAQREEILSAIAEAQGNRAEAARILGIDRSTLWRRMHRLGIADSE
jgi:transcriptional regulator with PAS, ATPase and Fis domain